LCNAAGLDLVNRAKTSATVSTVSFAAGGALVAAGVVLLVTALPVKSRAGPRSVAAIAILPDLAPSQVKASKLVPARGGLQVVGAF
jgi:hypothetical protein